MRATILLCDWAEVINGKLYAQGIGWDRLHHDKQTHTAVAVLLFVPYDLTNRKHHVTLELLTEDGGGYPEEAPISGGMDVEVGRPPGTKAGQEMIVPFALRVDGLKYERGGYRWELKVNDELVETASLTAQELPQQGRQ